MGALDGNTAGLVFSDAPLPIVDDSLFRISPPVSSCGSGTIHYEQIVNYSDDGQKIIVQRSLQNSLSDSMKAALVLHEVIYAYLRSDARQVTSSTARRIVGLIYSNLSNNKLRDGISSALSPDGAGPAGNYYVTAIENFTDGTEHGVSIPVSFSVEYRNQAGDRIEKVVSTTTSETGDVGIVVPNVLLGSNGTSSKLIFIDQVCTHFRNIDFCGDVPKEGASETLKTREANQDPDSNICEVTSIRFPDAGAAGSLIINCTHNEKEE